MNDTWTEIVPQLPVKNLQRALDYYRDCLGFELQWNYGENFASVTRGNIRVFLALDDDRTDKSAESGYESNVINVYVEDVNAVFEELKARGARILSAPEEKPWGTREFAFEDIDGHLFRVHTLPIDRTR